MESDRPQVCRLPSPSPLPPLLSDERAIARYLLLPPSSIAAAEKSDHAISAVIIGQQVYGVERSSPSHPFHAERSLPLPAAAAAAG